MLSETPQQPGDALIAKVGLRWPTRRPRRSRRAGGRRRPTGLRGSTAHFASAVSPGTRLVVAIAPALTIGLVRPSPLRSTAASELKGRPVALAPSFAARRFRADRLTDQREDEGLGHAHDREFVVGVADREDLAAGPGHADAEQAARHPSQGRIDLRIRAVLVRPVKFICLLNQPRDLLVRRQVTGRYVWIGGRLFGARRHDCWESSVFRPA